MCTYVLICTYIGHYMHTHDGLNMHQVSPLGGIAVAMAADVRVTQYRVTAGYQCTHSLYNVA